MTLHPHPLPNLTVRGNGEERFAQIERIQARGERLRRVADDRTVQHPAHLGHPPCAVPRPTASH